MLHTDPKSALLRQLTPKQREVLALVADNRTSKEIAGRLGISESAVNQRIEGVRTKLGGIPRGELARLFRQEDLSPRSGAAFGQAWQKIQVPRLPSTDKESGVEGIPSAPDDGSPLSRKEGRNGSQLSAIIFGRNAAWLSREDRPTVFARGAVILALVLAGMTLAAAITELFIPSTIAG